MMANVLTQPRSMAFAVSAHKPLLQRVWDGLQKIGAHRAASELRREASMRYYSNPEVARAMMSTAQQIDPV